MTILAWNAEKKCWNIVPEAAKSTTSIETSADIRPAMEKLFRNPDERQRAVIKLFAEFAKTESLPIQLAV